MNKRWHLMLVFLIGLCILGGHPARVRAEVAADVVPPVVTSLDVTSAYNDLDAAVVITGSGFTQDLTDPLNPISPTANLGNTALKDVTWVSDTTLDATVPWGMDSGVYTLTVTNPDGGSSSLSNAFTVKAGIGVWNSGNLFGGEGRQVLMKPGDPNTLYVLAYEVGLFRSRDAGENWTIINDNVIANATFVLDPSHPTWLYSFQNVNINENALFLSQDEGDTWKQLLSSWPDGAPIDRGEVFVSPTNPNLLFVSAGLVPGNPEQISYAQGLIRSTDGGASWQIVSDLQGIPIQALAFHPSDPLQLVLGTQTGKVYQSLDGGSTWNEVNQPPVSFIDLITYNPYRPSEVWVTFSGQNGVYKSTDANFSSWQDVTPPGNAHIMFIKFTSIDEVYANAFHSTDGGLHWNSFGPDTGYGEVTFDPDNMQIAYIGDIKYGLQKTTDGGLTWQVKNQGLAGMRALQLLGSQADAQRVYTIFASWNGIYRSYDAAASWTFLPIANSYNIGVVREDPFNPDRLFVAALSGFYVSENRGNDWSALGWNLVPSSPAGLPLAMALDPYQPGHILVGFRNSTIYHNALTSSLYSSSDYGVTWTPVTVAANLNWIHDIQFHPETPGMVFLSTEGTGIYRSTDSGASWKRVDDQNDYWMQWMWGITIATHPKGTLVVAACNAPVHSQDNGDTWQKSGSTDWRGCMIPQFVDRDSTRLYAGTYQGLYFSSNTGSSWTAAAGSLGSVHITAVSYGVANDYSIVYAATTGGVVTGTTATVQDISAGPLAAKGALVNAGVYRYVKQGNAPGAPGVPVLVSPSNNALLTTLTPRLDWKPAANVNHYQLQVSTDKSFATTILDKPNLVSSEFTIPAGVLSPNTKYYWRVCTYNSPGKKSAWSAGSAFRTVLPTPVNPGLLPTQNLRPSFSWAMPTYSPPLATGFTVQIATDSLFLHIIKIDSAHGLSDMPSVDLPRNQSKLYWRVRANGANGPSDWTNGASFSTGNPPQALSLVFPANNALIPAPYTPQLSWKAPSFPPGSALKTYHVEVALDPAFNTVVAHNDPGTDLADTYWNVNPALNSNQSYYWHVQVCNGSAVCSDWSTVFKLRTAIAAPNLVSPNDMFPTTNRRQSFSWANSAGATSYTIQTSVDPGFRSFVANKTLSSLTYIPAANLPVGTIYWRVRANGPNGPSDWSTPWRVIEE